MAESAKTKIVILGAGFGGTYTFKHLHERFHKDPAVELALVDRHNYFLFTPLLHEVATGGQTPINIVEPLRQTLCCLAHFYLTEVRRVNLKTQLVETDCGAIPYDYLVLALGATTNFYGTPGAAEHAFTLKTLSDAVKLKNHCLRSVERAARIDELAEQEKLLHMVVIGGGATGVELAAELADLFGHTFAELYQKERIACQAKITLLQSAPELLLQFPEPVRRIAMRALQRAGIQVKLNAKVVRVEREAVALENGERLETATPIWVAGIKPQPLTLEPDVPRADNGKIPVNEFWQIPNRPNVFALGDLAAPAPALAQAAVKESQAVARNIIRLINGKKPKKYAYRHSGDLVSLGHWNAVGKVGGFTISGKFAWWLWRTVYLSKMLSWRKKLKVAVDWTINLFSPRDISEL